MAESSERSLRWSGSTGVGGAAPVEVSGSPVSYRIGPLEYQPPVFCKSIGCTLHWLQDMLICLHVCCLSETWSNVVIQLL